MQVLELLADAEACLPLEVDLPSQRVVRVRTAPHSPAASAAIAAAATAAAAAALASQPQLTTISLVARVAKRLDCVE